MDISKFQLSEKEWQCPDENCQKKLSRKQTLITHIQCSHKNLASNLGK